MSCSDSNPCFDIGTQGAAFGVQGNSTGVSATQTRRLCWSMLKINGFNKHLSITFLLWGFRAHEAPRFIAGSRHFVLHDTPVNT